MILQAMAWATAALFIAFETNAVYEYLKLLPILEKITKIIKALLLGIITILYPPKYSCKHRSL